MPSTDHVNNQRFSFLLGAALIISVILTAVFALNDASQEALLSAIDRLDGVVETHFLMVIIAYTVGFAALTSLALPVATVLTVGAGFLFGALAGTAAALASKVLGAALTFAAVRMLGKRTRVQGLPEGRLQKILHLMDQNAVHYVFLLRIVPLAPHFVVNAGAAMTQIRFRKFIAATFLGLIPAAFVYAALGASLDSLLEGRESITPAIFLQPQISLPLLGLIALIIVSLLFRNRLFNPRSKV